MIHGDARRPVSGFFGKIPARGDFVRAGLFRDTVEAWDRWCAEVLAGSRDELADHWLPAWMEAPVWRFALPDGMCGPDAVLGLWMPSVDRAGRHFPLMFAACCPGANPGTLARGGCAWLDAVEEAGRATLADDIGPDALMARLAAFAPEHAPEAGLPYEMVPRPDAGLWWTEGSPRVPAHGLVLDAMPDVATFVAMLDAARTAP